MNASLLGTKIQQFRVVNLLGRGGMGEVYAGYDEKLERKVALKTLHTENRLDPEAKARFLREARILSQLAHPGICQIFDFIETDAFDVLVLELIRGRNLREALKEGMGPREQLQIAQELTAVLIAAHAKGVIHRDLKPDNAMLTEEGRVKVLDFGLSRSIEGDETIAMNPVRRFPPAPRPPSGRKTLATRCPWPGIRVPAVPERECSGRKWARSWGRWTT
jgi:serine/threonine protein kinase